MINISIFLKYGEVETPWKCMQFNGECILIA